MSNTEALTIYKDRWGGCKSPETWIEEHVKVHSDNPLPKLIQMLAYINPYAVDKKDILSYLWDNQYKVSSIRGSLLQARKYLPDGLDIYSVDRAKSVVLLPIQPVGSELLLVEDKEKIENFPPEVWSIAEWAHSYWVRSNHILKAKTLVQNIELLDTLLDKWPNPVSYKQIATDTKIDKFAITNTASRLRAFLKTCPHESPSVTNIKDVGLQLAFKPLSKATLLVQNLLDKHVPESSVLVLMSG